MAPPYFPVSTHFTFGTTIPHNTFFSDGGPGRLGTLYFAIHFGGAPESPGGLPSPLHGRVVFPPPSSLRHVPPRIIVPPPQAPFAPFPSRSAWRAHHPLTSPPLAPGQRSPPFFPPISPGSAQGPSPFTPAAARGTPPPAGRGTPPTRGASLTGRRPSFLGRRRTASPHYWRVRKEALSIRRTGRD